MNIKKALFLTFFLYTHITSPAASSSSSPSTKSDTPSNIETYIEELKSWHATCRLLMPKCTILRACAMILKHRRMTIQDSYEYPLTMYMKTLENEWKSLKECYILCKDYEACAILLRNLDNQQTEDRTTRISQHPNASQSKLWPSFCHLEYGARELKWWYKVCQEAIPECTLIDVANLILTHQIKSILPESQYLEIYSSCFEALEKAYVFLNNINNECSKLAAFAYCLKHPYQALPKHTRQKEDPTTKYVMAYKEILEEKKLMESSFNIIDQPRMDRTWQQVACAGLPGNLIRQMIRHKRFKDNLKDSRALHKSYVFHGYPGVGKSSAARMFAMLYQRPLLKVRCEAIQTKWQASAVENLNALLAPILKGNDPWVIVFEELDALQKTKPTESGDRSNALTLLQSWVDDCQNQNLIMIGTTNYMKDIPDSLERRIAVVNIPLPDFSARATIAEAYLNDLGIQHSEEMIHIIAKETGGLLPGNGGLTGSEIQTITKELYGLICDQIHAKKTTDIIEKRKRIATLDLVHLAIQTIKDEKIESGKPLTLEGRKWQEFRNSKDFWPTVNAVATYAGLSWSIVQGAHSMYVASEQLDIARSGLEINQHQSTTGDAQLEVARAGLAVSRHQSATGDAQLEIAREGLEISQHQLDNSNLQTAITVYHFHKERSWKPTGFDFCEWWNNDKKHKDFEDRFYRRIQNNN